MALTQWPTEPINPRRKRVTTMVKLMRAKAVELMEACDFSTASALSTGRLKKKINRLDRAVPKDLDLESEELNDLLDFVMEAIENGHPIEVVEDRPNIPAVEQAKTAQRAQRETKGFVREFDGRQNKYDWNEILNGKVNVLEQGTDYDCKSQSFGMQIRGAAKRKGVKVKVAVRQGQVIVQAIK